MSEKQQIYDMLIASDDTEDNTVRQQFELVENKNAKFFKLGFTL